MNRRREKLINAVLFFASHTENCGRTKLMKLLSSFEFEIFKQTGLPPIGLKYYAWDEGPLPLDFWIELTQDGGIPELTELINIANVTYPNCNGYLFTAKKGAIFNEKVFSPREFKALREIADSNRLATATELVARSHEPGTPWSKTVEKKGPRESIDYIDVLDNTVSSEEVRTIQEQFEEFLSFEKFVGSEAVN